MLIADHMGLEQFVWTIRTCITRAADFFVLLKRLINYLISDTTHVQQRAKRVKSICPLEGYTFKQQYLLLAVGGIIT